MDTKKTLKFFAISGALALGLSATACDELRGDSTADNDSTTSESTSEQTTTAGEASVDGNVIRLTPGFSPNPMTVRAEAGGDRRGSTWRGTAPHTDCAGNMPEEPQHILEIGQDFENLRIVASHTTDLTMAIEGPAGTWCNDDFQGLDPGIQGAWPAGTYRVFVGTYSEGVRSQYTLTLQQFAYEPIETTNHTLRPGFSPNPFTVRSDAGGTRMGASWTGTGEHVDCRGYMPDEPQHIFELGQFEDLSIIADHQVDLTMAIEGPSGTWCNDDYEGLNPGIRGAWPAGTYRVFVGTYSGDMAENYTLRVQQYEVRETTVYALSPGFLPDPYTETGLAGGPRDSFEWTGTDGFTDCQGNLPREPQHILELDEFSRLKVVAESNNADLTMIVEGPSGTWCNDDFEGLNPGFNTAFPAGTYRFFVGVYSGSPAPYTFLVTEL